MLSLKQALEKSPYAVIERPDFQIVVTLCVGGYATIFNNSPTTDIRSIINKERLNELNAFYEGEHINCRPIYK